MPLETTDLMGNLHDKVQRSIDRIKSFEPLDGGGYFLAFSGGKDSVVLLALAKMAKVKYDAHYSVTTVDPPELVHFIRDEYPEVIFDKPRYSMRQLIIKMGTPPSRMSRYCCSELKEVGGKGRVTLTGTRWAESNRRKTIQGTVAIIDKTKSKRANTKDIADKEGANYRINAQGGLIMNMDNDPARRVVELCYRTSKTLVNPIIDWEDEDVWEFIHRENLPYCKLYDEGFTRLGCIGCPISSPAHRKRTLERWPYMFRMYLRAFDDMLKARRDKGRDDGWETAEEVMEWWLSDGKLEKPLDGQISMDDMIDDE